MRALESKSRNVFLWHEYTHADVCATHQLRHRWCFVPSHATHRYDAASVHPGHELCLVDPLLYFVPYIVVHWVKIWTVEGPQVWCNERGCLPFKKFDCVPDGPSNGVTDQNPDTFCTSSSDPVVARQEHCNNQTDTQASSQQNNSAMPECIPGYRDVRWKISWSSWQWLSELEWQLEVCAKLLQAHCTRSTTSCSLHYAVLPPERQEVACSSASECNPLPPQLKQQTISMVDVLWTQYCQQSAISINNQQCQEINPDFRINVVKPKLNPCKSKMIINTSFLILY